MQTHLQVYTCFVENTGEALLNADHILSVVELIEQRPVLAEVWWYVLCTVIRLSGANRTIWAFIFWLVHL